MQAIQAKEVRKISSSIIEQISLQNSLFKQAIQAMNFWNISIYFLDWIGLRKVFKLVYRLIPFAKSWSCSKQAIRALKLQIISSYFIDRKSVC